MLNAAPRALQGPDPRPRVELRLRRQRQHRRDLRELPAAQDRQPRPAAHPDGARRGLHHPRCRGTDAAADACAPRTRLLLALLGLVAAGLLVAGFVTYSSLRSFLLERVDQQLRDARGPVAFALASGSIPGLPEPGRPGSAQPAAGHLRRAARPPSGSVLNTISFAYGNADAADAPAAHPRCPARRRSGASGTLFDDARRPAASAPASASSCRRSDGRSASSSSRCRSPRRTQTLGTPARPRAPRLRAGARRPRRGRLAASSSATCGRWRPWPTPPARSPPATSRSASSRPSRARKWAGSASASTSCSTRSRWRSRSAPPPRRSCGASSPTPRTSCARRSPASAATPSCSSAAPRTTPRTSPRRCAASRRRASAWA